MSGLVFISGKRNFPSNILQLQGVDSERNGNSKVVESDLGMDSSENIERVKKVVEKYNRALEQQGKEVQMNFDKDINRVVIRIFDKETSKLVYEFPYKEIRHLIAMLQEFNDTIFNEIA